MLLKMLGGLSLVGSDFSRPKPLLLAGYLTIEGPKSRRDLAELFWPDVTHQSQGLRTTLFQLNKEAKGVIATDSHMVWSHLDTDLKVLQDHISKRQLNEALNLYDGPFLDGIDTSVAGQEVEEWIFKQREQLASLIQNLELDFAELEASQENYTRAAQRALTAYHLRFAPEPSVDSLKRFYILFKAANHPQEQVVLGELRLYAMDGFELRQEQAKELIKQQTPVLIKNANPYKGLSSFTEKDSKFFFGREEDSKAIISKLLHAPYLVTLTGNSGSGKSSLLFSGVIPELKRSLPCHVISFRPNQDPFVALALALAPFLYEQTSQDLLLQSQLLADQLKSQALDPLLLMQSLLNKYPEHHLVLLVDQLEELFSEKVSLEASLFLDLMISILGIDERLSALFSLRADFLGEALKHINDTALFQASQHLIAALKEEKLRQIISLPAQKQAVAFEAGLIERMLSDLKGQQASLPLLEFSLTLLWEQQSNSRLSHEAYDKLGGVAQALAQHADSILSTLSPQELIHCKHIFMQLVISSPNQADRKRLSLKEELLAYWPLVTKLASYPARLLVIGLNAQGQETVEMIHEALIEHWQSLQKWLEEGRAFRLWKERFTQDYRIWQQHPSSANLLQGYRLEEAKIIIKGQEPQLSDNELSFIEQSKAQQDFVALEKENAQVEKIKTLERLAQNEQAQRKAEQARLRLQQNAVRLLSLAGIIGLLLLGFLINTRNTALRLQRQTELQRQQSTNILAEMISIKAEQDKQDAPSKSLLLALEAFKSASTSNTKEHTETVLLNLLNELGGLRLNHNDRVLAADFSPDGQWFVTASNDSSLRLWRTNDLTSKPYYAINPVAILNAEQGVIFALRFSPEGSLLATAGENNTVALWLTSELSSSNAKPNQILSLHKDSIFNLDFSPDAQRLVLGSFDKSFSIWQQTATGFTLEYHSEQQTERIRSVAFSPDARWLAVGVGRQAKGELLVFRMDALSEARVLSTTTAIRATAFSPDGAWLATSNELNELQLWETQKMLEADYEPLLLVGHSDFVVGLAFSHDGFWLASSSRDKTARLWFMDDVLAGLPVRSVVLKGHEDALAEGIRFSSDDKWLLSTSIDASARIWDLAYPGPDLKVFPLHTAVRSLSLSEEGSQLATGDLAGTVNLYDPKDLRQAPQSLTKYSSWVEALSFSNEGLLATSSNAPLDIEALQLFNSFNRERIASIRTGETYFDLAFSPEANLLATASETGTVSLWALSDLSEPLHRFLEREDSATQVAFSPNAKLLAEAGFDAELRLWNLETLDDSPLVLEGHSAGIRSLAFHPDGTRLASADVNGDLFIWSLADPSAAPQRYAFEGSLIWSLAFSHEGNDLAILTSDNSVFILRENEQVIRLQGHTDDVWSAVFNRDDSWLMTASEDASLRFWHYANEDISALACRKAGRNLSREEWQETFFDSPYQLTCPEFVAAYSED